MSGKRRATLIRQEERDDILSLARAGYTYARIAATLDRDERTIAKVVGEERAQLRELHADRLMATALQATEVAASRGDARPAIDLLDRIGAIPETSRQRTSLAVAQMTSDAQHALVASGAARPVAGPTIQIGIAMPGQLPASGVGANDQILDVEAKSAPYMRLAARPVDEAEG